MYFLLLLPPRVHLDLLKSVTVSNSPIRFLSRTETLASTSCPVEAGEVPSGFSARYTEAGSLELRYFLWGEGLQAECTVQYGRARGLSGERGRREAAEYGEE